MVTEITQYNTKGKEKKTPTGQNKTDLKDIDKTKYI